MSPTSLLIFIFNAIPIAPICHVFPFIFLLLPRQYHLTSKAELTLFHLEGSDWSLNLYKFGMFPHEEEHRLTHIIKMLCLTAPVIYLSPPPPSTRGSFECRILTHLSVILKTKTCLSNQTKVLSLPSSCSLFCHFKFSGHFLLTYGVPLCCMCHPINYSWEHLQQDYWEEKGNLKTTFTGTRVHTLPISF